MLATAQVSVLNLTEVDIEGPLPEVVTRGGFEAIILAQVLPWVHDVPRLLLTFGRLLKPDGLLLADALGANSFSPLTQAWAEVGVVTGRVLPQTDILSAGMALQKLGFALPVVDRDTWDLHYTNLATLWADLRACGATNLHPQRSRGCQGQQQWRRFARRWRAVQRMMARAVVRPPRLLSRWRC